MIFGALDLPSNTVNARVCRQWSDIALGVLWREVDDLYFLFRILAPLKKTVEENYEFERSPLPDDWKRFMKYSTKVRLLSHQTTSTHPLHQSIFDTIARTRTTLNILPNIHTVHWQNPNLNLCIIFMHANIRHFTFIIPINFATDSPRPFFLEITSRMPHLTNLDIRSSVPMHTIETEMISLIEQLPKLKKITFPRFYLTTKVAESLSRLSHLEIIEFQYSAEQGCGDSTDVTPFIPNLTECAFPSLWDHSMTTTFDDAARFINAKFSPTNLTMLYIDSDFIETPSSIHNFLSVVAENCQLLQSLALVSLRDASSVPDIDQATDDDITLDVLKPLLKLPGLLMMELVHQHQLALNQVDIELLASSWPSLETLILNNEPVHLARSNLTLKALLPFAKHCHKLTHLGLFLDATTDHESFGQVNLIPFYNLKRLSMGVSIIADSDSVALCLSCILPPWCKLDSGITWDEGNEISTSISLKVEERCQTWSKVAEMLPMLCTLRMQERERSRMIEKELEDLRMRTAVMSDIALLGVRDSSSCIMI
ncbi:hypothetical protein BYT27DRAFT_7079524 [Phlegmacium glaucopus]|nr:hypothetical protein BYT27DRAFT_7079524 [Phlegmacium glaucopus]